MRSAVFIPAWSDHANDDPTVPLYGCRRSGRLLAVMLAACAPDDGTGGTTPGVSGSAAPGAGGDCAPENLETLEEGMLTIATDQPAYEPWMVEDDPTNG